MKKGCQKIIGMIGLSLLCLLTGCIKETKTAETPATAEIFAMDTVMNITVYGEEREKAVDEARKIIREYDNLWSEAKEDSDISKINQNSGSYVTVEPATYDLLKQSAAVSKLTNSMFDITLEPVVKLWGFHNKVYRVPTEKEKEAARAKADYRKIKFAGDYPNGSCQVKIEKGMEIGVGGIAKGYTSDKIISKFREMKVSAAILSLGGNVQTLGYKAGNKPFRVGITNPLSSESILGTLDVTDRAVITSGNYERYFEKDGRRYHHIMDRRTGAPAENTLASVTVIGESGTMCDGLSTALFVMGKEKALEFQNVHTEFDVILITGDGEIISTEKKFIKKRN